MPTNLRAGQVAIIGYNSEDTNSPNRDTISFILLTPILSGTQIFFTDRAWNGTTFANAGGGDDTYTYTAGADLAAGTVIRILQSDLPAGMSLSDGGETIYAYQGAINAPTTFLFAADIADGNNTFNGSLVNTGLSVAANTAVAISYDNASFAARGHDINYPVLLDSIADFNDWTGNDNSLQVAPQGSLANAPDQEIWVAGSGGGHALIRMGRDGASYTAEDITHLLQNSSNDGNGTTFTMRLWHPTDIVFDTVHNKMFVADSDGSGHNRIVQFNISDFLNNPGVAPTGIILYQDANIGVGMVGIQVDINTGHIYYGEDTHIYRLNYDAAAQTPGIVAHLGTNVFVQDFVLDLDVNGNGTAYIVNSAIQSVFGTDNISRNFLYSVTGITPSSTTPAATVNATQMEVEFSDSEITGVASANNDPQAFPKEYGNIKGIDLDPVTHILYFTTGTYSADHDGNSGTPPVTQFGGIWSYATIGNAVGHYDSVFRQDGVNGPDGLLYYVEIDHATGKYYMSDITGGPGAAADDQDIWVGNIAGGTPTQFGLAANIQGLTGLGMSIQTAPTLGGTNLNPGQTEQANNPSPNGDSPAPPVVTPANAFTASDLDTIGAAGGDNVAGAQVRISNNFLSNAVAGDDHQDILSISAPTTGSGTNGTVVLGGDTITFVYDAATGTMTFSGISTFANYQTVLAMVRFQATGDNPTGFGTAGTRTISYATFDGLLYSDEVHATVTITGLNDTPINAGLTGSFSATEDTNFALTGISVFDVDSDPALQNIVVTLSVAHGTLTILTNVAGGIIAGQITAGANNSATITLTATQNQINATLAAVGGLIFVPTADYNGADAITVVTNDQGLNGNDPGLTGAANNEQDSDSKTINIAAVVDIANDAVSVGEDSGANALNGIGNPVSLLANDTFENPTRFISAVTQGLHGSVAINNNGTGADATDDFVVYTVTDANYNGSDSFTYTVTSPAGVTEVATVNVTVVAANDPVSGAAPVSTSLSEDSVNFAVTGLSISDIDTVLAPAGVYNVTLSSTHGTMTLTTLTGLTFTGGTDGTNDATMTFHGTLAAINTALATATYTPTANYNGTDAAGIVLQVTDTFGGIVATGTGAATSDSDNISVTVTPVNDAPAFTGLNGTPTFVEGAAAVVLDNNATATDIDLTATNYAGATLTLARSGAASAQDVFGTSGTLSFSGSDVLVGATMVGTFTQTGGTLTITFNSSATQALVNSTLQQLTYSNNSDNPPTSAVIAYVFSDGNSGVQGPGGPLTGTGSVTVAITPTNDAPTAILSNHNLGPATEQTAFDLKAAGLSVGDIDGNSGSETVTLSVGQGVLNVTAGTSGAGVSGSGTGTVTITGTILQINALLNTDPTSTVSYLNSSDAPAASTSLTLTIHDNGATGGGDLSASDAGTISITAVNDGPANTKPGTQTINEDGTVTFSAGTAISVSDPDVGAGTLTVTLSVLNGQLTLSGTSGLTFALGGGDGIDDSSMTFTGTQADINAALAGLLYETTLDYNGSDTLTITTSDDGNTGTPGPLQDVDTVTINITAVADIANDSVTVGEDSGANNLDGIGNPVSLLSNDSFENPGRFISAVTQGAHGSVTIDDNGTGGDTTDDFAVYTPDADYNGADSFTYTVTSAGVTETATVNVTVTAAADILDDSATTNEDSATNVMVLGNDSFEATPAITNVGAAAHGTAVVNDNGSAGDTSDDYIVYTPDADYNGTDSFTYTVMSGGVAETATVTMTIDPVADIADDSVSVIQDSVDNALNLLANDSFESAARFISAVGAALHGTTAIDDNGTVLDTSDDFVTYTPTGGYNGPDSFTYTVMSGGVAETATVTVNVSPPLDLSLAVHLFNAGNFIVATYATIQEAVDAAANGYTITVAAGTYAEQVNVAGINDLTIKAAVAGASVTIEAPLSLSTYAAHAAGHGGGLDVYAVVTVQNSTGFSIEGIDIDGAGAAGSIPNIDDDFVGIFFRNASGSVLDADITGMHDTYPGGTTVDGFPTNAPYQRGSGVVADNDTLLGLTITGGSISDFQKNAGRFWDADLNISGVTVTGGGAQTGPAQNGFVVESGTGTISGNTLTDIGYAGTEPHYSVIIYIRGADDVDVTNNIITGTNDATTDAQVVGIAYYDINSANGGGHVTGNTISWVDTGIDVEGDVNSPAIVVNNNSVTNVDFTDALSPSGVYFTPTETTAFAFNIEGSDLHDTLAGGAAGDRLLGLDGDDDIDGLGGNDLLNGGLGADHMSGGAGDDIFIVDDAGDVVSENSGEGLDTIYTSASYALGAEVERMGVNGFSTTYDINLTGNGLDNELWGNDGVNLLDGGAGADILRGFDGDDVYVVDNPGDVVVDTTGFDTIYTSINYALGDTIERLFADGFTTTNAISMTGNALDNEIIGNDGFNLIDGGTGADVMSGNGGNDIYFVDNAGDVVVESSGGGGMDTVYTDVGYALGDNIERLGVNGFSTTFDIALVGNSLDNEMWGNDGRNILIGGAGADIMHGFGGDDVYIVDNAGDVVVDSTGFDLIFTSVDYTASDRVERLGVNGFTTTYAINLTGNDLDNEMWGNDGANVLDGGLGADILRGNGGADTFSFTTTLGGGNVDQVVGFETGVDKIALDDSIFSGLATGALDPAAFRIGSDAQDADDRIIYDNVTGALYFDADGNGAGVAVQFATLHEGLPLTASDFSVI